MRVKYKVTNLVRDSEALACLYMVFIEHDLSRLCSVLFEKTGNLIVFEASWSHFNSKGSGNIVYVHNRKTITLDLS